MALVAARAAAGGASGAEALEAVEARPRGAARCGSRSTRSSTCARAGGSAPRRRWLGSALQIKPILTLEEEITPVERVRTRRRAFERMVEFARERKDAGADAWVVQHIHDPDTARRLVDECRQVFGTDPVFVSEIGPVIGAHIGPGLLGVGGIRTDLLLD